MLPPVRSAGALEISKMAACRANRYRRSPRDNYPAGIPFYPPTTARLNVKTEGKQMNGFERHSELLAAAIAAIGAFSAPPP